MVKKKSRYAIKNIYGFNAVKIISIFLSLICFLILAFTENRKVYQGIIFLPLAFLILSLFYDFKRNIKGLGSFMACIFYLLRFTVFPVLMAKGDYRSDISNEIYEPYFNKACVLMIAELIVVFFLFKRFRRISITKLKKFPELSGAKESTFEKISSNRVLLLVMVIFLLYNIFIYVKYPSLLTLYWRIVFYRGDDLARLYALEELIEKIPGTLYYPFKLTTELLHYLIPIVLVVYVNKNNKSVFRNLCLTFFIIVCALSVVSSEQINSIIITVTIVYYILLRYSRYTKILVVFGLFSFLFVIIFAFKNIANTSDIGSLGRVINEYFNGPINIAVSIHMKQNHFVGIRGFANDIIDAIPIVERITDAVSTNTLYGKIYNSPGAIMPMTGYGYYYFGLIGCWIPAALVISLVNIFDEMLLKKINPIYQMIIYLCIIHAVLCVFMYNLCIYFSTWVYTFVPLLFIFYMDVGRKKRTNQVVQKKSEIRNG